MVLVLAILALAGTVAAQAACPQSIPDCLSAATAFSVVADKLLITKGAFAQEGYVDIDGADVTDVCAGIASINHLVDRSFVIRP